MTNKFEIGDYVEIKEECSDINEYPWFHRTPMKIIARNDFYYFTDYWEQDAQSLKDCVNYCGITEECLRFSEKHYRKQKLNRVLK